MNELSTGQAIALAIRSVVGSVFVLFFGALLLGFMAGGALALFEWGWDLAQETI